MDDINLKMLAIDQMVPEDHLVRKLEAAIDFNNLSISSISGLENT
ncbi:hypothetical protein [Lysinibacillus sp. UGB7]